jgi:hypothetical protein
MAWRQVANMEMEREIFGHCVIKDRYIYVFGGFNEIHLDTIERFDVVTGKWKLLSLKLKIPLQNCTAVAISDELIALIGGYSGLLHKTIFVLNVGLKMWNSVDYNLKVARRKSHCYKFNDKVIFELICLDLYIRRGITGGGDSYL